MNLRILTSNIALSILLGALPVTAINFHTVRHDQENATMLSSAPSESYFREPTSSNLLYVHIFFMSLSWVAVLPISVALDLARSSLWRIAHIFFIGLHVLGVIFGLAYNSKTPDLYPNNAHGKLGWVLTGIVPLAFLVRLLRSSSSRKTNPSDEKVQERVPFIPYPRSAGDVPYIQFHNPSEPGSSHFISWSSEHASSSEEMDRSTLGDVEMPARQLRDSRYAEPMSWVKRWSNVVGRDKVIQLLDKIMIIFSALLVVLGFVAACTGVVTMAGIFKGKDVFNGLAHFIKGGVFVWYGILTLSRWMGCFADLGWAWNLKTSVPSRWSKLSVTMEGVECVLIFIYGIANIFLEHLSAWGEPWAPQDFEHVAICLLFIGGGLCGMMVESRSLSATQTRSPSRSHKQARKVETIWLHGYSINPVPAMLIFILGIILGGHHQKSMEASMMHKWVGNLLAGASAARCVTYLILALSPPTSTSASRPPSELIASFCLTSGGFMLMASNRDTVEAVIQNGLNAMLVATVTMGLTAMLMSWVMLTITVKRWAERRGNDGGT